MEMDLENILKLKRDSELIDNFFNEYNEKIKDPTCDKYGAKFNYDNRFSCFGRHEVFFSSWVGYYGNSSSSSFGSVSNTKTFWRCFDEYLNDHKEEIFKYISEKMMDIVKENKSVVEDEIKSLNEFLNEINKEK